MNSPSSTLALDPRASPVAPTDFVVKEPLGVPARTFPCIGRGADRSCWKPVRKLSYVTYACAPSGERAIAGKSGRSPASAMFLGVDHESPRLVEKVASACSWPVPSLASDQTTPIVLLAPAPVGAPLAMSTLGKLSVRAPATPSNTKSPLTGSGSPTSTTWAIARGVSHLTPPSSERSISCTELPRLVLSQNTYTRPLLSVFTEQPWRPVPFLLLADALSVTGRLHVAPPSLEWLTATGAGPLACWLLNCV